MRHHVLGKRLGSIQSRVAVRAGLVASILAGLLWATQGTAAAGHHQEDEVEALAKLLVKPDGRPSLSDPADCAKHLQALTEAHAPASLTFKQAEDIPELKAGEHAWSDARAACAVFVRADRVTKFVRWASVAKIELTKTNGVIADADIVNNCLKTFDDAIKVGVPPSEPIDRGDLEGTMQEIRDQLCAAGAAKLAGEKAAREAPFRKLLKNDKLAIWLKETYIDLPGGGTSTPARLAAANTWFQDLAPDKVCNNGLGVHTLYRYQFDRTQKLVKTTVHDFCGRPPASAWR